MRLTVEEHREAIKRYSHIKPARGWRTRLCSKVCPGPARTCGRAKGHRGPHAAFARFGKVVAVWESGTGTEASPESSSRISTARDASARRRGRPVGLRTRESVGLLQSLKDLVVGSFSSVEEIVFIIMFIAFVKFAFDWIMLIMGG